MFIIDINLIVVDTGLQLSDCIHLGLLEMKILKTVQRHYVALGISSTPRLSERVLAGFLLYLCVIVLQLMYTFHMAGDFMESVEYVCSISGTIVGFVFFAAIVFNRILLFESIANIEQLIDTSEP